MPGEACIMARPAVSELTEQMGDKFVRGVPNFED